MSEQDSFINEVTEEVRRDRFYSLLRRYGWLGGLLVVLIVGGAAFNEYRRAQDRAEAQALGDTLLSAFEVEDLSERADAIAEAQGEGRVAALIGMLAASQTTPDEGRAEATERLNAVAADADLDPVYRDLAILKSVLMAGSDMAADARIETLAPLTAPGAPYRVLALEVTALAHAEAGDADQAISILTDLVADAEASQGLRRRASQMIVALGGSLDAS